MDKELRRAIKILARAILWTMPTQMVKVWERGSQNAYCRYCRIKATLGFNEAYFDKPHKSDCLYEQVKELADG